MQSIRASKRLAAAVAVALSLAVPGSALAISATQTVPDTFTVTASVTLTGAPASIDYGAFTASGSEVASGPMFELVATTNNGAGVKLDVTATDLTGTATVASTARWFFLGNSGTGLRNDMCNWTGSSSSTECFAAANGGQPAYPGTTLTLGTATTAGTWKMLVTPKVNIPGALPAGTYNGSMVFAAVTL